MWTAGYEGRTLEDLRSLLVAHRIGAVADVRANARSRKAGFDGEALAAWLPPAGIAYHHFPTLGCARGLRDLRRATGDVAAYEEAYAAHLGGQEAALASLAALARTRRTLVLCMERRVEDCHRRVLGRALAEQGFRVRHL